MQDCSNSTALAVQERRNSSALAMELCLSCTKPLIYSCHFLPGDPCQSLATPCPVGTRCAGFSYQKHVSVAYAICQPCPEGEPCEDLSTTTTTTTTITITPPLHMEPMAQNVSSTVPRDVVNLAYPLANTATTSCDTNPCLNGVCTPLRDGINCNCRPGRLHSQKYILAFRGRTRVESIRLTKYTP